MATKEAVLDSAMQLPADERLDVAEELIASVAGDDGAEAAWAEEIRRRIEAIDSGRAELIPWEEVRKRMAE